MVTGRNIFGGFMFGKVLEFGIRMDFGISVRKNYRKL
jgi:hypothetical protein